MVKRHSPLILVLAPTVAIVCVLLGGCAQEEMTWSGSAPAYVSLERSFSGSPVVIATDEIGGQHRLLVDTGSPGALIVAESAFADVDTGGALAALDLEVFGLSFRAIPTQITSRLNPDMTGFDGIIGAELLRHFALDLDYVGRRAALRPDEDVAHVSQRLPALADVGDEQVFQLTATGLGGSRLAFDATIEGRDSQVWIDTGAAYPVAYDALQPFLDLDPDRPRLGGISALTSSGVVSGYVTRVGDVQARQAPLVDDPEGEAALEATPEAFTPLLLASVSTMVFPDRPEPADIFSQGLAMSLGTSVLERYVTRIDYKHSRLHLWQHNDTSRFVDNPWRDLGFALELTGEGFAVLGVWQDTVAADADIAAGDRVLTIDGAPLEGLDWEGLVEIRNRFLPGAELAVELSRQGREPWTVVLPVVDWLPDYATPGPGAEEPALD
jgi:hypothetical protein